MELSCSIRTWLFIWQKYTGGEGTHNNFHLQSHAKKNCVGGLNLLKCTANVYCDAPGSYFGLVRNCKLADRNVETAICAWCAIYSAGQSIAFASIRIWCGVLFRGDCKKGVMLCHLNPKTKMYVTCNKDLFDKGFTGITVFTYVWFFSWRMCKTTQGNPVAEFSFPFVYDFV